MATPSSSATSPSPPMAYIPHPSVSLQPTNPSSFDAQEREQRKKAVEKFLARAEISMVTRALRARLSYASYKATNNIPHVPLKDLEAQTQSQTASFSRTIAAKRKAVGASNPNNYQTSQSLNGMGAGGAHRRVSSGSMAPPSSVSSPRGHHHSVSASAIVFGSGSDMSSGSKTTQQPHGLYASILAPPPTKQARTIHNVNDPPVPAPTRPTPSPRARSSKTRTSRDVNRPPAKAKQPEKPTKAANSPDRRKNKRADKGKQKQDHSAMDIDGDVDMKAAATLTSLLLHHRPTMSGSASSPRSSIDGSETGSAYSYSHFAQSSARTTTTGHPNAATPTSLNTDTPFRSQTPPPTPTQMQQSTPRPAPTDDNEAADLMLYLATSPSPARNTNKDSKDLAAYRALGGAAGPLRSKGRVLFPSMAAGEPQGPEGPSGSASSRGQSTLMRGAEGSFNSSISSIGTEMDGGRAFDSNTPKGNSGNQLLPPPPLPAQIPSPSPRKEVTASPRLNQAPGMLEFNFNDFINASPSPSRGTPHQGQKSNLGLRADVGRKLFEEEQMRQTLHTTQSPGKRQEDRSLGASIDLVSS